MRNPKEYSAVLGAYCFKTTFGAKVLAQDSENKSVGEGGMEAPGEGSRWAGDTDNYKTAPMIARLMHTYMLDTCFLSNILLVQTSPNRR